MTRTRLLLILLFLITPAANNKCNFPASPAGPVSEEELARREKVRRDRINLARDCAVDDVVLFGEVIRMVIERLPTLSYDSQWVSLPHAGGLDATVNIYLSGGNERRELDDVGDRAFVEAIGSLGLGGPRVVCWFTIERTATGYRVYDGAYAVHDGSCGLLRLDALDVEFAEESLPDIVATGGAEIAIGSDELYSGPNPVRGRVEFDGVGGGAIAAAYGGTDVNLEFEFGV